MSTTNGGPNIITNGLVIYLDAANPNSYINGSTTWIDLSRSNLNGTLINGPTFNSSNGGSIVFDGVDDYVNLGTSINFSTFTSGFTIGFWIKILNTSNTNRYVFSKLTDIGNDNQFSVAYGYVSQTLELYSGACTQNIRTNSQIVVNDNNWHLLYYTVGITTKGYLDDVVKFTNTYGTTPVFSSSTNTNFIASFNGSQYFSNIAVGSMVLYNRILTPTEVLQNYNSTKTRFGL